MLADQFYMPIHTIDQDRSISWFSGLVCGFALPGFENNRKGGNQTKNAKTLTHCGFCALSTVCYYLIQSGSHCLGPVDKIGIALCDVASHRSNLAILENI